MALVDIRLYCNDVISAVVTYNIYVAGSLGTQQSCPNGLGFKGFIIKQQSVQAPGDNTAANGIKMICEDGTYISPENEGPWGTWSAPIYCPTNYVICGYRTQYDITSADKSGLNNIDFMCCPIIIKVIFFKCFCDYEQN